MTNKAIHKQKCNDKERLNVNYFFNLYSRRKIKHSPACFDSNSKAKRKVSVDINLYKKILLTYFKFYFIDLYFRFKPLYFFLGGECKIVKTQGMYRSKRNIGWLWYHRPTLKFFNMCSLIKLKGSSNRIPKLEDTWYSLYTEDKLPIFTEEFKRMLKTKSLYRSWTVD